MEIKNNEFGWSARPPKETTVGQLDKCCKEFGLEVMVFEGEVMLTMFSADDPPTVKQLNTAIHS